MASKKVRFFILLDFFKVTYLKLNYISQKKLINIGFNIIFCALFNDIGETGANCNIRIC